MEGPNTNSAMGTSKNPLTKSLTGVRVSDNVANYFQRIFSRKVKVTEKTIKPHKIIAPTRLAIEQIQCSNRFAPLEEKIEEEEFENAQTAINLGVETDNHLVNKVKEQAKNNVRWVDKQPDTITTTMQTDHCDVGCNPMDGRKIGDEFEVELFCMPNRHQINKTVKHSKRFKAITTLTYYLKIKYFLKTRDTQMIQSLVMDARVWMIKNGFKCDCYEDLVTIGEAVTAAYIVDDTELKFRQTIKHPANWKNTIHLNKALAGDLGKTSKIFDYRENSLMGSLLPNVKMPSSTLNP